MVYSRQRYGLALLPPIHSEQTGNHGFDFAPVLSVLRAELFHHESLFGPPFHAETA
jgi:hypothetical protein